MSLETNGTMNTVDASTYRKERPRAQRRLSLLLDEKIGAKLQAFGYVRHESNSSIDTTAMSDISEDLPRPRTKLSILLDEKISAKIRRKIEEESAEPHPNRMSFS